MTGRDDTGLYGTGRDGAELDGVGRDKTGREGGQDGAGHNQTDPARLKRGSIKQQL